MWASGHLSSVRNRPPPLLSIHIHSIKHTANMLAYLVAIVKSVQPWTLPITDAPVMLSDIDLMHMCESFFGIKNYVTCS